jgi:hypothetical protein
MTNGLVFVAAVVGSIGIGLLYMGGRFLYRRWIFTGSMYTVYGVFMVVIALLLLT